MDKKKFKDFLNEVAVIKDEKPTTTGYRLDENSGGEVRYNGEWVEVGRHANPTLGFKFVKLKEKMQACELGCGEIVSNQIVEKRFCESPRAHWRTRCSNCGCFVSPDGEGFISGGAQIHNAYVSWFRTGTVPQQKTIAVNDEDDIKITSYSKDRPSRWSVDSSGNITKNEDDV